MSGSNQSSRITCFVVTARAVALLLVVSCVLALPSAIFAADPPKKDAAAKTPAEQANEQANGQLAKAWAAFLAGKYDQAMKECEPLMKLAERDYPQIHQEATHIQARSCWAAGKNSQARATQLWATLEKASSAPAKARMKISAALGIEAQEGPATDARAVEMLAALVAEKPLCAATAEAALDLARIQVKLKKYDDAQKTLASVAATLDKKNVAQMEMSEPVAEVFRAAAVIGNTRPWDFDCL